MAKSNKKETYEFRIIEVRKSSHFENDPAELQVSSNRLKEPVQVDSEFGMRVNPEQEALLFKARVIFFVQDDGKDKKHLFGVSCAYTFQILDFAKNFMGGEKKQASIPKELLSLCLNFIISGMRGMLAALNTRPEYSHIVLPVLDPSELVERSSTNSESIDVPVIKKKATGRMKK